MYNNMYGKGNCYDQTVDCNTNGLDATCSAADNYCYQVRLIPNLPLSKQKAGID